MIQRPNAVSTTISHTISVRHSHLGIRNALLFTNQQIVRQDTDIIATVCQDIPPANKATGAVIPANNQVPSCLLSTLRLRKIHPLLQII